MTKPISPNDLTLEIPNIVIETFNKLIEKDWDGYQSIVLQDEVLDILEENGFDRRDVFRYRYLDIEDLYNAEGWEVVYYKPMRGSPLSEKTKFSFTKRDM